jgi:potassium-transporting ATPase KdpC subunit
MIRNAVRATLAVVILAVLTGLVYPLAMTGFAQVAVRGKADGSIVTVDGHPVASSMIGQLWKGPQWFYGRPSAIDDDASTSSGSNLGPTSKDLADAIKQRVKAIVSNEGPYHPGLTASQIPVDLLTASASGLDPDISPAAAMFEAPRIAAVRNLPLARVQALIRASTHGRTLGFLGEPRVNVLDLNLSLVSALPGR